MIQLTRTDKAGSVLIRVEQISTVENATGLGFVGTTVLTFNNGHSHSFVEPYDVRSDIEGFGMLDIFVETARPGDNTSMLVQKDEPTMIEPTIHLGESGSTLCTFGNGRTHAVADTYAELKNKLRG
jgi:hypothetical protein